MPQTLCNSLPPVGDGGDLDGSEEWPRYSVLSYWALVWGANPFSGGSKYNGFDGTTNPPTGGDVPEFY